jgi:hypothetical protein
MIKIIDLHYRAWRLYKRALKRGDVIAALDWSLILDYQNRIMRDRERLRIEVETHRSKQKKSKRRNPRVRKKQAM